jgi:type VI protein secretion system component VasK
MARTQEWEARIEKIAHRILLVAVLGLLMQIAYAINTWKAKSAIEQRVELLESGRRDQQNRNDAEDLLNQVRIAEVQRLEKEIHNGRGQPGIQH